MVTNLSKEQKEEFKDILETLGESLDITKEQYDNRTQSYRAVGTFLENDPAFADYKPLVTPQGSLRLGTIIQPINRVTTWMWTWRTVFPKRIHGGPKKT
ncbi:MAG: hypothetical protein IJ057_02415 [Bacteroidales bacterium]|nr:hypothetical protein [Bacteroidales bacterium]